MATKTSYHLQSSVQNESTEQCGKHIENEVDQTLKKEIMDYMDDPRKGAYNLGKDSSHSDSNSQFRDKTLRVIQVQ